MRRILMALPFAALMLAGCSFDGDHNREHRAKWRQGMREFHDQLDKFIIDPLTFE